MLKKWLVIIALFGVHFYGYSDETPPKGNCVIEIPQEEDSPFIPGILPIPNFREFYIHSDGAKLFCRTIGKGSPVIVVHGGPGMSQDYFLPYMYKLAQDHFVILYDQRGCGLSEGEVSYEAINMEQYIRDLDNVRKAFHFPTVSILGHSWGGFLAMNYALEHPESVEKLILSNTMPASREGLGLFIGEYERRIAPYADELCMLMQTEGYQEADPDIMEQIFRIWFRAYCYYPEKADLINLWMSRESYMNGRHVYRIFEHRVFMNDYDFHYALQGLAVPTLVIHGDYDPIPVSTAEKIVESLPVARFVVLNRCGHFPFVEEPEAYFEHVEDFLNEEN